MFALDQAVWGKAKTAWKQQLWRWDLNFHELEDPHNQQKPVEFQKKNCTFLFPDIQCMDYLPTNLGGGAFKTFVIFIPTWGDDPIWLHPWS